MTTHLWGWQWAYLVYLVLAYQTAVVLWRFWWKAPSNVIIAAYPTPLGRWLTALRMMVDSETLLQNAYDQANGKPFAIPMTDRWVVFITDRAQLKRLDFEPESVLSTEEALHELAFTKPIMAHLQVQPLTQSSTSEASRIGISSLKNKLRSSIPSISDAMQMRIREALDAELVGPKGQEKQRHPDGWRKIQLMPALLQIFTQVNLLAFVGEDLAGDPGIYRDIMGFFWTCARAFPVFTLVPDLFLPLVSPLAMGFGLTRRRVYDMLLSKTRRDLDGGCSEDNPKQAQGDVARWAVELSRVRDAAEVAKISLGLLFASAFQVPMIAQFCIVNLCKFPQYASKLEDEARDYQGTTFSARNQEMPYMDSFMKETARLSPGIIFSAPRKVVVSFTSPDGYHVPSGNWIAVPQLSVMRDEKNWPHAKEFEGFRFVDEKDNTSTSRFTHPGYEFPFWGAIRHACPARFYVSVVMKMILSQLLLDYEFKLADPTARPFWIFGKTRLPNPFMSVLIRKRVAT